MINEEVEVTKERMVIIKQEVKMRKMIIGMNISHKIRIATGRLDKTEENRKKSKR